MAATIFFFQDMEELQKIFNQFDTNDNDKISLVELGGVLKDMGSACSSDELQRVMDGFDTKKGGFISLDEFASLCHTSSDVCVAAFDLRDFFSLGCGSRRALHPKTRQSSFLSELK